MTALPSPGSLARRQYRGDGRPARSPLPGAWTQPEPYRAPGSLVEAVNTALYLRRPLLLEGEPGTGKTRLAYAVAYELGYPLKEIYIRSTSRAQDLLYTFNAVRRLYEIQKLSALVHRAGLTGELAGKLDDARFVELGELGRAIELSMQGIPSVVLIDEIDKADLDFPNDLLLVLDRLQFAVAEVPGLKYDALGDQSREQRRHLLPLVIITSNREKELPAPFLRRCLFSYIPFPDQEELAEILARHFLRDLTPLFAAALDKFWALRDRERFQWRKPPGTSELLDWVRLLERDERSGRLNEAALRSLPLDRLPYLEALLKTQSDRDALQSRAAGAAAPNGAPLPA